MLSKQKPLFYAASALLAGLALTFLLVYLDRLAVRQTEEAVPYLQLFDRLSKTVKAATSQQSNEGLIDAQTVQTLTQLKGELQTAFETAGEGKYQNDDEGLLLALRSSSLDADEALHSLGTIDELKRAGAEEGIAVQQTRLKEALAKVTLQMESQSANLQKALEDSTFWLATSSKAVTFLLVATFVAVALVIFRLQRNRERVEWDAKEKLEREGHRMQTLTGFIEAVSNGNYDIELESQGKDDHVSDTLLRMRAKLKENAEQERKRTWATSGLAQIGDILRGSGTSSELFDSIIQFIVKYTRSNQGGLFILNDDDSNQPFLELAACYAYERKRYLTRNINIGDGLVGQCFLEKERTYLQEIPEDFVKITSGLGGTTPKSILVVPLKVNETVFGVIELATFTHYEEHEIELIEKFAESIASTVSSVKTNERTRVLLEQTQQQAEEMKSQEEEMRQNMEELSATQEQLQRQMTESEAVKEEMTQRAYVFGINTILSESDRFGTILYANNKLAEVSKYSQEEMIGKGHNLFRHPQMPKALFRLLWETIQRGEVFRGVVKNKAKDGTHYWVDATIVPIKDKEGQIVRYIGARYHITNDELAESMYLKQMAILGIPPYQAAS